jgi:tetratricopeptide (TPR) repeat protein
MTRFKAILFLVSNLLFTGGMMLADSSMQPATFDFHFNEANNRFREGKTQEAIVEYKKAIELNPQCQQAYLNLGLAYVQDQKWDEAISCFENAIRIDPQYIKAHIHLGICFQNKDKTTEAVACFRKAYALNEHSHDAMIQLARTLCLQSQFDESIQLYRKALKQQPKDTALLLELGNTLNMNNNIEEALSCYQNLLELIPDNVSVLYNIAYTLKKLGRIDEAFPVYQKVLKLDPSHGEAHFSLGLAYLAQGDFDNGWPEYEWRWQRGQQAPRNLSKPQWDGSDLHGKTLLLHAEQGLGDTFQFIRYARITKEKGARVVAAVQPALIQLLSLCSYIDKVVSLFEPLPQFDFQIPMLTVPYVLKTNINTVPAQIPYLFADEKLTEYWQDQLSRLPKNNLKVGICWQGNSGYSTHFLRTTVAAKSIKLAKLLPLLKTNNVTFINLQKTTGEDQLTAVNTPENFIIFNDDFDNSHGRFMDTAAVIKNLDLMITVDTSMAHLSAGLGCPTWVFMPEPADWRWMLKRTDTPWYPNMRLFRQSAAGDWESVISTVALELQKLVEKRNMQDQAQATVEQALNKIDATIMQLNGALYEKECSRNIDKSYNELAMQLYRATEEKNNIKRSILKK